MDDQSIAASPYKYQILKHGQNEHLNNTNTWYQYTVLNNKHFINLLLFIINNIKLLLLLYYYYIYTNNTNELCGNYYHN